MKNIDAPSLKKLIENKADFQLIDVRQWAEHEAFNIGGQCIPDNLLIEQIPQISKVLPVIFYCEKGIRSTVVIQRLNSRYGFRNLINLKGGITAWKKEFPQ